MKTEPVYAAIYCEALFTCAGRGTQRARKFERKPQCEHSWALWIRPQDGEGNRKSGWSDLISWWEQGNSIRHSVMSVRLSILTKNAWSEVKHFCISRCFRPFWRFQFLGPPTSTPNPVAQRVNSLRAAFLEIKIHITYTAKEAMCIFCMVLGYQVYMQTSCLYSGVWVRGQQLGAEMYLSVCCIHCESAGGSRLIRTWLIQIAVYPKFYQNFI